MSQRDMLLATIPCDVSGGMFTDERSVLIVLPDRRVSALVDRSDVVVDREPNAGETVKGRVRVAVVDYGDDWAMIDLPQPSLSEGTRFKVPRSLVETAT